MPPIIETPRCILLPSVYDSIFELHDPDLAIHIKFSTGIGRTTTKIPTSKKLSTGITTMRSVFQTWPAILFSIALASCGGGGDGNGTTTSADARGNASAMVGNSTTSNTTSTGRIEPLLRKEAKPQDVSPFRQRSFISSSMTSSVVLPPLATEEKQRLLSPAVDPALAEAGSPLRIGISRSIDETFNDKRTMALLNWTPSSRGGQVAAVNFRSTGAGGLRLGLLVRNLPMASVVRFYVPGSLTVFESAGQEILASIQRNVDAGDTTDAAHTYWSPDLGGDEATMEIEVPKGIDPLVTEVSVPYLSHIYLPLGELSKSERDRGLGDAGPCQSDVTCDPSYDRESRSIALMSFVENGNTYKCNGTLMNDRTSSGTPYFLSANHCVSSQTVASTLLTMWFYRSSACANATPLPERKILAGGATLLYASAATDTSFMRLNTSPPAGTIHAGSSSFAAELGMKVFALHNPHGDLQKLSMGTVQGFSSCSTINDSDAYSCATTIEAATSANFLRVGWQQGVTEPGSSGSGLFTRFNNNSYLIGQLRGGASSCVNPMGTDTFGRFDRASRAALSQWLNRAPETTRIPVFRFYNVQTATHFYTTDIVERDRTITKYGNVFIYEGPVFYAYGYEATKSNPVYRFYNQRTDSHFYTISDTELANVMRLYPWFAFEGTSWYASAGASMDSTPVFRFYNKITGTHFYTISATERDMVRKKYPQFLYEGSAYEAWTAP